MDFVSELNLMIVRLDDNNNTDNHENTFSFHNNMFIYSVFEQLLFL